MCWLPPPPAGLDHQIKDKQRSLCGRRLNTAVYERRSQQHSCDSGGKGCPTSRPRQTSRCMYILSAAGAPSRTETEAASQFMSLSTPRRGGKQTQRHVISVKKKNSFPMGSQLKWHHPWQRWYSWISFTGCANNHKCLRLLKVIISAWS